MQKTLLRAWILILHLVERWTFRRAVPKNSSNPRKCLSSAQIASKRYVSRRLGRPTRERWDRLQKRVRDRVKVRYQLTVRLSPLPARLALIDQQIPESKECAPNVNAPRRHGRIGKGSQDYHV